MKYCSKCLYPDTKPGLGFENGVCDACRYIKVKEEMDWGKRRKEVIRVPGFDSRLLRNL